MNNTFFALIMSFMSQLKKFDSDLLHYRYIFVLFAGISVSMFSGNELFGQAPQKMSYQAVMRNNSGQLLINKTVGLRISILKTSVLGTTVYTETQTPTSNSNGLISIQVGGGAGFSIIDWGADNYFIKTEMDPAGGTAYSITSTTQLLSVPYALYAGNAGNGINSLGTPGSSNANGGSISGNTLTLSLADATNPGLLKSADWTIFNNKVGSVSAGSSKVTIGGTATAPTVDVNTTDLGKIGLSTGTTGTDVSVSGSPASLGGTLTLNIPDASATARGVVTTGTQTFAGAKTFNSVTGDPVSITGTGFIIQPGAAAYTQLVVDNATGAIRKAPSINTLQDVLDNTITTPPGSPSLDDSYIVPSGATGAWSGNTNKIATWNGTWTYYTPANNDKTTVLTGTNAGNVYMYNGTAWTQVVNSSGTSISDLIAAKGVNTIDNKNFAQTWNWSTASTGSNGLIMNFNGLTSGTGLSVASSATGLTGNLLNINTASTGAFTNGGIRFNFTGAHTGNGFQIDDVTTTGIAMDINANSITSGSALDVNTSNASLASTNGFFRVSNSAAATGSNPFVRLQPNSTAGSGITLTNAGNVGIGTTTPTIRLEVNGAATNSSATSGSTSTIDFSLSNIAFTSFIGTALTLTGLKSGGAYSLILTGTTNTGTTSFTASGFSIKYMGTVSMIAGKTHIYSFVVAGTVVYVTMAIEN